MKAYADTSFLVSLYTPDVNSSTAAAHMKRLRAALPLTPLHELELLNALELRVFRGELTVGGMGTGYHVPIYRFACGCLSGRPLGRLRTGLPS